MFRTQTNKVIKNNSLFDSKLYDQDTFYRAFIKDLESAKKQVIIESPFMTTKRISGLLPVFYKLRRKGIQIVINTKPINEHDSILGVQVENAIGLLQDLGILVLFTTGHHRKLAIIDEKVIWEGSLNILSQNDSCEFMRRITSQQKAKELLRFLNLRKFID